MAKTRITNILVSQITERKKVITESIGDGACSDYPHYRDQCGYLRALNDVVAIIDEIEGVSE